MPQLPHLLLIPFSTVVDLNQTFQISQPFQISQAANVVPLQLCLNWHAVYEYQNKHPQSLQNTHSPLESATCINIALSDFYFEQQGLILNHEYIASTQRQKQCLLQLHDLKLAHLTCLDDLTPAVEPSQKTNKINKVNKVNKTGSKSKNSAQNADQNLSAVFLQQHIQSLMQKNIDHPLSEVFNPFEFTKNQQSAENPSSENMTTFRVFKNGKLSFATPSQHKIWQHLLTANEVSSYENLADLIGSKSLRAVGTAVGKNPFAYLGRCHLVLPKQDFQSFQDNFKQQLPYVRENFLTWLNLLFKSEKEGKNSAKSTIHGVYDIKLLGEQLNFQEGQDFRYLKDRVNIINEGRVVCETVYAQQKTMQNLCDSLAQNKIGHYFYGSLLKYIFLAGALQ